MIAIAVRNPFAFPFTLPPPLTGVITQGQTIILPWTETEFFACAENLTSLQVTRLPAWYPGPFDTQFIGEPFEPPPTWAQPQWFIDPANVTGKASDSNPGNDPSLPVRSYNGGVARQWGTTSPTL